MKKIYNPVQLPQEIHAKLKEIAFKEKITIINVVKKLLENYTNFKRK